MFTSESQGLLLDIRVLIWYAVRKPPAHTKLWLLVTLRFAICSPTRNGSILNTPLT